MTDATLPDRQPPRQPLVVSGRLLNTATGRIGHTDCTYNLADVPFVVLSYVPGKRTGASPENPFGEQEPPHIHVPSQTAGHGLDYVVLRDDRAARQLHAQLAPEIDPKSARAPDGTITVPPGSGYVQVGQLAGLGGNHQLLINTALMDGIMVQPTNLAARGAEGPPQRLWAVMMFTRDGLVPLAPQSALISEADALALIRDMPGAFSDHRLFPGLREQVELPGGQGIFFVRHTGREAAQNISRRFSDHSDPAFALVRNRFVHVTTSAPDPNSVDVPQSGFARGSVLPSGIDPARPPILGAGSAGDGLAVFDPAQCMVLELGVEPRWLFAASASELPVVTPNAIVRGVVVRGARGDIIELPQRGPEPPGLVMSQDDFVDMMRAHPQFIPLGAHIGTAPGVITVRTPEGVIQSVIPAQRFVHADFLRTARMMTVRNAGTTADGRLTVEITHTDKAGKSIVLAQLEAQDAARFMEEIRTRGVFAGGRVFTAGKNVHSLVFVAPGETLTGEERHEMGIGFFNRGRKIPPPALPG